MLKSSQKLSKMLSQKLRKIENSMLKSNREVIVRGIVEKLSKKIKENREFYVEEQSEL